MNPYGLAHRNKRSACMMRNLLLSFSRSDNLSLLFSWALFLSHLGGQLICNKKVRIYGCLDWRVPWDLVIWVFRNRTAYSRLAIGCCIIGACSIRCSPLAGIRRRGRYIAQKFTACQWKISLLKTISDSLNSSYDVAQTWWVSVQQRWN